MLRRLSYDDCHAEQKRDLAIARPFCCDADFSFSAQMLHFVQHDNPLTSVKCRMGSQPSREGRCAHRRVGQGPTLPVRMPTEGHSALRRHEGATDLSTTLALDRDVLKVRIRARQPPRGRDGLMKTRVNLSGLHIP